MERFRSMRLGGSKQNWSWTEQTQYIEMNGVCTTLDTAAKVPPPVNVLGDQRICHQSNEENGDFKRRRANLWAS